MIFRNIVIRSTRKLRKILKKVVQVTSEDIISDIRSGGGYVGKRNMFTFSNETVIDPGRLNFISIGNGNVFSKVNIFCHDYSWTNISEVYNELIPDTAGEVIIGNNNFFGYDSVILKDVRIGDNNIIGARSLITSDIPNNEIWSGVPAKKIGNIEDIYTKNKNNIKKDVSKYLKHFQMIHERLPLEKELGFLSIYFIKRTEESYNQFFKNLKFKGERNSNKIKKIFFDTLPIWNSYEQMIKELVLNEERSYDIIVEK